MQTLDVDGVSHWLMRFDGTARDATVKSGASMCHKATKGFLTKACAVQPCKVERSLCLCCQHTPYRMANIAQVQDGFRRRTDGISSCLDERKTKRYGNLHS